MKLTSKRLKEIIKEELGKIKEKIELGNYEDRMAQKSADDKKAKCRSLTRQITDAVNSQDMSSPSYYGPESEASQEEIDQMNREYENMGCSDLKEEIAEKLKRLNQKK